MAYLSEADVRAAVSLPGTRPADSPRDRLVHHNRRGGRGPGRMPTTSTESNSSTSPEGDNALSPVAQERLLERFGDRVVLDPRSTAVDRCGQAYRRRWVRTGRRRWSAWGTTDWRVVA